MVRDAAPPTAAVARFDLAITYSGEICDESTGRGELGRLVKPAMTVFKLRKTSRTLIAALRERDQCQRQGCLRRSFTELLLTQLNAVQHLMAVA